jgi:hypothetical protein
LTTACTSSVLPGSTTALGQAAEILLAPGSANMAFHA